MGRGEGDEEAGRGPGHSNPNSPRALSRPFRGASRSQVEAEGQLWAGNNACEVQIWIKFWVHAASKYMQIGQTFGLGENWGLFTPPVPKKRFGDKNCGPNRGFHWLWRPMVRSKQGQINLTVFPAEIEKNHQKKTAAKPAKRWVASPELTPGGWVGAKHSEACLITQCS